MKFFILFLIILAFSGGVFALKTNQPLSDWSAGNTALVGNKSADAPIRDTIDPFRSLSGARRIAEDP
ncbi:hypothetical protein L0Y49_03975, partial [bacterium]|nr:hypothetical protein [bacterium]